MDVKCADIIEIKSKQTAYILHKNIKFKLKFGRNICYYIENKTAEMRSE